MQNRYDIRIEGHLPAEWSDWFDNMKIYEDGDHTILSGMIVDQAALHGILDRIRDLNLKLISVNLVNQKDGRSAV